MPFRAEDVQSAGGDHFIVLFIGLLLVAVENLRPLIGRDDVFVARVIPNRALAVVHHGLHLALRGSQRLRDSLLHALLLGHEFRIAAEQNVGSAAGHIRCDRDHAFTPGLSHDFSLLLVLLGVQDPVLHTFFLQQFRQPFRLFDRSSTHQHRLPSLMQFLNLIRCGKVFFSLGAVNHIWMFQAQQRPIGGGHHHFQPVNLVEFRGFRFRSTGHARQLLVHAEIILEGDGRQRLVLALNLDVFLGLHRLVQPVRPAPARHQPAGELIHDDDFAVFHYVFHIAVVERVCFHRGIDVVLQVPVFRVSDVADPQQLLDFLPAFVGDCDVPVLLIDHVVSGEFLRFPRRGVDLFSLFELGDDSIHARILVGGLLAGAGNNQRGASFVDQNGIHFVHDAEIVPALHAVMQIELHVVAQVIKPELVVGAVGHVCCVSLAALLVIEIMHNHPDRQAQKTVELAHPLRVAFGQIVVDRNHVYAAAAQGI